MRVTFSLPFTYIDVDFAGPFNIKVSKCEKLKRYAAVFVFFSTGPVHLEPYSVLSTDAFLACFDRLVYRMKNYSWDFVFLGASNALIKGRNEFLKTFSRQEQRFGFDLVIHTVVCTTYGRRLRSYSPI